MTGGLVVLAAGGTGGHMFPAEALAREMLARGYRVALVTDRRGQAFGDKLAGVAVHRIRAGRLGAGIAGKAVALLDMALGTLEARRLLRTLQPAAVVGFGGYPSVPTMLAATRQGFPTLIHEQNAVLGRANRLLAPRVAAIATSFATVAGLGASKARIVETGNPVRPEIAARRGMPYEPPRADGPVRILITGGSQGARILSAVVPAAIAALDDSLKRRLMVAQQARSEDLAEVRAAHRAAGIEAEVQPFFDDVPERLAKAQLVIARAGASTVAELAAIGRPAILVPYRFAADDHQAANARAFATTGAARVIPESEFTPQHLRAELDMLLARPETLAAAAAAAHRLGRPDAARALADLVAAAMNGGHVPLRTGNAA
jgi:UDP-N-acetylglucosamine--N-acetylmuramyl-(pentapeptide) pyrophosphoryl-undecaprenol N-acetylglucosamine transferase